MSAMMAFWSILQKDMKNYYLKPPNISWGIIFPTLLDSHVFYEIE